MRSRLPTILFEGNGTTPAAGEDGAVMAYLEGRYGATNVTYMQVGSVNAAIAEGYDGLIFLYVFGQRHPQQVPQFVRGDS